jgi:phosphomannomutase
MKTIGRLADRCITKRGETPVKKLFVFDLDGTLAPSKSALPDDMADLLGQLLDVMKVAVISGGSWTQFETQLLANLPKSGNLSNLVLLPTCGTQFFTYDNGWHQLYAENLSDDEKKEITDALNAALDETGFRAKDPQGELIEDRGSQITLSALGQQASLADKETWDPDFAKRKAIIEKLTPRLPQFAIRMGGTTSIDITKPGIDKAYGIAKLEDHLSLTKAEMIFAGDAIFPGGNDYPVKETGVDSVLVRDPEETARVVQAVVFCTQDAT